MKKALVLLCLLITFVYPVVSQTFVSDEQSIIERGATEIIDCSPHDRVIVLDSLGGSIKIELLNGRILRRNVKFITHVYDSDGVVYDGYYETPQGEKIYMRNNEIGFHAMKTLGCFITYTLKGTIQPTKEQQQIDSEQTMYNNILQLHGVHDADCYKYKRIEEGIDAMTVRYILGVEPIYEELFWKEDNYIGIKVYTEYVIRIKKMKVDKVIKMK